MISLMVYIAMTAASIAEKNTYLRFAPYPSSLIAKILL